jgi:probable rRNA maturation factor
MPDLHLSITPNTGIANVSHLRTHLLRAHRLLHPPLRELSLALVDDAGIKRLHRRFLGNNSVTDVLSFPLEFDAAGHVTAGEIVVCVPQARRQARCLGTKPADELLLYALHGLLHLCGWDDRTAGGFAAMHAKEDSILHSLGIGRVFAAPGEAP